MVYKKPAQYCRTLAVGIIKIHTHEIEPQSWVFKKRRMSMMIYFCCFGCKVVVEDVGGGFGGTRERNSRKKYH